MSIAATHQDSKFALGSQLNRAVNRRLEVPTSPAASPLAGARDTFARTMSRDVQAGARLLALPRHLLNHLAGGQAVAPKASMMALEGADATNVEITAPQRRSGLLWNTLSAVSENTARAAGGACGLVGTAVGAAGGLVLPAISQHSAQDCVRGSSRAFARGGEKLTRGVLTGVSVLLSEAVAGVSAAITGLLAGVGALAGGLCSLPHGAVKAFGAAFRRQGVEATKEALVEEHAAGNLGSVSSGELHRVVDDVNAAVA